MPLMPKSFGAVRTPNPSVVRQRLAKSSMRSWCTATVSPTTKTRTVSFPSESEGKAGYLAKLRISRLSKLSGTTGSRHA